MEEKNKRVDFFKERHKNSIIFILREGIFEVIGHKRNTISVSVLTSPTAYGAGNQENNTFVVQSVNNTHWWQDQVSCPKQKCRTIAFAI